MNHFLEPMLDIAREAATVVLEVYETPFSVDYKGPSDPVTAADRRANDLICQRLASAFPGIPVVAEESDPESFGGYRTSDRVFFVDPLDGTAEFIGRNGEFVVMIGLVEGDRAVAGVIVAPAKNTTWVGSLESGAWELTSAARRSIRVSDVQELGEARVVSSRSHRSDALERALALLGGQSLVPLGSAGLKGAAIADAVADVYVGTGHAGKRWDACAVDALVSSAGGRFSDMYGTQIDYRAPSLVNERGLVATNRSLHDRVLERLEPLRA